MNRVLLLIYILLISLSTKGQEVSKANFYPPFKIPLLLSGNFAEIRSTHLHAGVDFKTNGAVDVPMYALADGYIKAVRISNGSGYVLEMCYLDKYISINRHLHRFIPSIEKLVEDKQYQQKNHQVSLSFSPTRFPVKAGDLIGYSGNTGYSFGPHLHLEILDIKTMDYLDPLSFLGFKVKDKISPKVEKLMIIPKLSEGLVKGSDEYFQLSAQSKDTIEVWGKVGLAIKAYDYMEGSTNKFGIYKLTMKVDGKNVFSSLMDRFNSYESSMMHSWAINGFMRSFVAPTNKMRQFRTYNGDRGWITIDQEKLYDVDYELEDVFGNITTHRVVLRGERQKIEPADKSLQTYVRFNVDKQLPVGDKCMVHIQRNAFQDDYLLKPTYEKDKYSDRVTLNNYDFKLNKDFTLKMVLDNLEAIDRSKLFIGSIDSKGKVNFLGGVVKGDTISVNVRELSTYSVFVDDDKPTITPHNKQNWTKNNEISLVVDDKASGISSCSMTIDGKYVVFWRPNAISKVWSCKLKPGRVQKGMNHKVSVVAKDGRGNVTRYNTTLFW